MNTGILHTHLAFGLLLVIGLWRGFTTRYRMAMMLIALVVLGTGAVNFMASMKNAPPGWHALVGIKVLLALHALAMVFLLARGQADAAKAARWRKGALISGSVTALIGLYVSNLLGK